MLSLPGVTVVLVRATGIDCVPGPCVPETGHPRCGPGVSAASWPAPRRNPCRGSHTTVPVTGSASGLFSNCCGCDALGRSFDTTCELTRCFGDWAGSPLCGNLSTPVPQGMLKCTSVADLLTHLCLPLTPHSQHHQYQQSTHCPSKLGPHGASCLLAYLLRWPGRPE